VQAVLAVAVRSLMMIRGKKIRTTLRLGKRKIVFNPKDRTEKLTRTIAPVIVTRVEKGNRQLRGVAVHHHGRTGIDQRKETEIDHAIDLVIGTEGTQDF
jgi:hypothetical protein